MIDGCDAVTITRKETKPATEMWGMIMAKSWFRQTLFCCNLHFAIHFEFPIETTKGEKSTNEYAEKIHDCVESEGYDIY